MSSDVAHRPDELVLYLTGDAGWRGKDKDVYTRLQQWGYAVAGVSAPDYLKSLPGEAGTTTPSRLAADFAHIIEVARDALALPGDLPVVLVGVSRGADLAVVAAGQSSLQQSIGGVVAIGLTREEEYVHRRRRATEALELYQYLPQLGSIPLSVIQSTGDNYVPAREARQLFGADTPVRRLHAIEARNHSFSNARPQLYETLRTSLVWLDHLGHRTTPVPVQ
ncbi:MAG: AcvB/VirJ family lysyl-phosphatidylglycerol hydrolase [Vicinamibacterales bacterium]